MDRLIPIVNKLQDVLNTIEVSDNPVDLPQLVIIGSQSSGKSSVIENICGKDLLPRGTDIVTRCPLVLQLRQNYASEGGDGETSEWAMFSHMDQPLFDFNLVRQEIEKRTNFLAGKDKGVVADEIILEIYSPRVLNLTLVDLPGFTKVPVAGQPHDIEKRIKKIAMKFISNPNSIILAVTPANIDLANSEALKIAKEVDPQGKRTIGILTKLDLMDEGTDAMAILRGNQHPLELGYVPVVNRSQKQIQEQKRIEEALRSEQEFFATHPSYKSISHRCGTPYLARTLSKILVEHIRIHLPRLCNTIETLYREAKEKHQSFVGTLGEGDGSKMPSLMQLVTEYVTNFGDAIEGNSVEIATHELRGGAVIQNIFTELNHGVLDVIDPCSRITMSDIRTAIRNSSGFRTSFLVSEKAFENLAKKAILTLEEPLQQCLELVHKELDTIASKCASPKLSRFPALKEKIVEVMKKAIAERRGPTTQMIHNLVMIEAAYINTSHPQFKALSALEGYLEQKKDNLTRGRGTSVSEKARAVEPQPEVHNRGFFSMLLGSKPSPSVPGSYSQTGSDFSLADAIPSHSVLRSPVSEGEETEIAFTKNLLVEYFSIVKSNLGDSVPKSIIFFMIQNLRENITTRLIEELYNKGKPEDDLFQEDQEVKAERLSAKARMEALSKALDIIKEVSYSGIAE